MKSLTAFVLILLLLPYFAYSQPRVDPAIGGKPVTAPQLMRMRCKAGDVFHYKISLKSQVSVKNSDDLLKDLMPNLKANDKALYTTTDYITLAVRGIRNDGATDFAMRVDSIHSSLEGDGGKYNYTSTNDKDRYDSLFFYDAVYTGYDFGLMVDTLGNFKEVYGVYNVIDLLYEDLDDSLQTDEEYSSITDKAYGKVRTIGRSIFTYLPYDTLNVHDTTEDSPKVNYAVWSTIEFPMQKEYKDIMTGFEERGGKMYAIYNTETTMTPSERVIDEKEYSTTLPNYSYLFKGTRYIDVSSGMLAYHKWTEEKSYAMKIESKLAEKAGKSFATVQRSKIESVIELMK